MIKKEIRIVKKYLKLFTQTKQNLYGIKNMDTERINTPQNVTWLIHACPNDTYDIYAVKIK